MIYREIRLIKVGVRLCLN